MTDNRSQRIILMAHCLLNQNAKVKGLSTHPGLFAPIISTIENAGVGIIQLPCPEFVHLGPLRPIGTDTVEQYNTPEYRAVCQKIAIRTAAEVTSYQNAGYQVICFLGVEGSPSCSVSRAPHLVGHDQSQLKPGSGIFVEILKHQFKTSDLHIPFLGIPESDEAGNLNTAMAQLNKLLC